MIDYLDKPPQRYAHVFQKNSGSREMVEAPEGEWVKFEDMDLYMFEGAQFMRSLQSDLSRLRGQLQRAREWMWHVYDCAALEGKGKDCTCGLTAFLAELNPPAGAPAVEVVKSIGCGTGASLDAPQGQFTDGHGNDLTHLVEP